MLKLFWDFKAELGRLRLALAIGACLLIAFAIYFLSPTRSARSDLIEGRYQSAYAKMLKAAERGDAAAQNALGNMHYLGLHAAQDYKAAAKWYMKAALAGNTPAKMNLGHIHHQGLGVSKDIIRAYAWFSHAEKSGSEAAENYITEIMSGFEVVPNMKQRANDLYPNVEALSR